MGQRTKKKPQALKLNPITEAALKLLAEVDDTSYNGYVEDVLEKRVQKASEIMMEKTGQDLYAMAKKKCESDPSYHKYM